ncbi:hypothetical protein PHLCEN_2v10991 [Hermanssonia centrifuga]|uniref:Uncharacterized protein n=1 Tax=Hermanssonia centrifuga TaxID=98765 RepID=A0A2R6NL86_9APHY|nr:hypothetical protein PHLCEN_2v10991 [Hermanssonia centrifuga]
MSDPTADAQIIEELQVHIPTFDQQWFTSTGSVPIPSTYLPTSILMAILTGLAMIAGDIVVLIVTWITTFKPLREARELKISNTLGGVFLRDGQFGLTDRSVHELTWIS